VATSMRKVLNIFVVVNLRSIVGAQKMVTRGHYLEYL